MPRSFSEILIATNNKGKFSEIKDLLDQVNIKSASAFDFNISEPEETEDSFAKNSLLKAKYYANKTGLVALADDSGLCVEALDGAPGVLSARFALDDLGNKNFPLAFTKIIDALKVKGFSEEKTAQAYFICNLTLFNPKDNFVISFEGRVDGFITFNPRGTNGFGYDPLFVKRDMDKTFGEIDAKIKDKISHRAMAFEKFLNWINS